VSKLGNQITGLSNKEVAERLDIGTLRARLSERRELAESDVAAACRSGGADH
jgi:hypothetical protein